MTTLLDYRQGAAEPGVLHIDLDEGGDAPLRKSYDTFDAFFSDPRLAALHLAREMPKEMCIPVRIVGVTAGGITVQTRRMARASSMWRRHRFPRGSSAHRHSVEDRLADGDDQRADRHQDDGYHRRRWHVGAGLGNLRVEDER